jgi:predicted dinucleotide-binding enzyme
MPLQKIGVIGSGEVGETLANGFLKHGYQVMRGSREPAKLADWKKQAGAKASTGTFPETAKFGELVVLAVKGTAAESAVKLCGPALEGKTVLDATNPIADQPPQDGVLQFFTKPNFSLMEQLQQLAPKANFVKCFNSVGADLMINPDFGGTKATMFICGNSEPARKQARAILDQFGWETEDMGKALAARAIEPLCVLWCIPGFTQNRWNHAFKLLRSK